MSDLAIFLIPEFGSPAVIARSSFTVILHPWLVRFIHSNGADPAHQAVVREDPPQHAEPRQWARDSDKRGKEIRGFGLPVRRKTTDATLRFCQSGCNRNYILRKKYAGDVQRFKSANHAPALRFVICSHYEQN